MGTNLYRHPPEVVEQVLYLHDHDWKPGQIVKILKDQGISVSTATICRWVNPEQAQKDRERNRDIARRIRQERKALLPEDPYAGLTGLARKMAMLEDRVSALEEEKEVLKPNKEQVMLDTLITQLQERAGELEGEVGPFLKLVEEEQRIEELLRATRAQMARIQQDEEFREKVDELQKVKAMLAVALPEMPVDELIKETVAEPTDEELDYPDGRAEGAKELTGPEPTEEEETSPVLERMIREAQATGRPFKVEDNEVVFLDSEPRYTKTVLPPAGREEMQREARRQAQEAATARRKAQFSAKYSIDKIREWAKEKGIFRVIDIARAMGATNGSSMNPYLKDLVKEGAIHRHGGDRGPGVFYTHKDYAGEISIDAARAKVGLGSLATERSRQGKLGGPATHQKPPEEKVSSGQTRALTLAEVRDWVLRHKEDEFGVDDVQKDIDFGKTTITSRLQMLIDQGSLVITRQGGKGKGNRTLYRYMEIEGPGAAAKLDQRRRGEFATPQEASGPVAGTGRQYRAGGKHAHMVNDLISACRRAGATVSPTSGGHIEVSAPDMDKKVLIASTPHSERAVMNDRARIRKAGLKI